MQKKNASNQSGCLSDKDIQLIRKTYAKITELYYENPNNQSAVSDLINLGHLITQVVGTKREADALSLVSIVETLKVKSKGRPEVLGHIDLTVNHLRMPSQNPIKYETLLYSLQKSDLFVIGCTVAIRFYEKIRANGAEFNWKEIIGQLSRNIGLNPTLCIELAFEICRENEVNCKLAVKSGLIKYVFLSYINSALDNKFNLYKAIKLLKVVSIAENTLIREKEKPLALVIYTYQEYIPVIQGIISKCYDSDYCQQIENSKQFDNNTLDQYYLWSYLQAFCQKNLSQNSIKIITKTITSPLDKITETKCYGILANSSKFRKIILKQSLQILPKNDRSLLNYIKLCVNCCEIDQGSSSLINMAKLQQMVDKSPNPKVAQLFKYLSQLKNKENKIGALSENIRKMFDMQKNADFMMERASKIPQNNEQLTDIRQILKQKDRTNQFQSDTLKAVKERALQSLHTAVIQKYKLDINPILRQIDLGDIRLLARLLQILQLYLMINQDLIEKVDANRVLEIIQWIQDHFNGVMIEWGSIGQLLIILKEDKEWLKHVNKLPQSCFWLLSIQDLDEKQQKLILQKLASLVPITDFQKKLPLFIGFFSRCLQKQSKCRLYNEFSNIFVQMTQKCKNGSSSNYKINLLMFSLFIKNCFVVAENEQQKKENSTFEAIMQPMSKIVFNNFRSLQQQYQFLQCMLPFSYKLETFSDNLDYLISMYGKLASGIYKKSQDLGNKVAISYDKVKAISKVSYDKSRSILQILNFLQENSSILQSDQFTTFISNLVSKKHVYWHLYPNFYAIVSKLMTVLSKTTNPTVLANITNNLSKLLKFITENEDMSQDQKIDLLGQFKLCLEALTSRKIPIQKQKLRKGVQKIKDEQIRHKILQLLDSYTFQAKIQKEETTISMILQKNIPMNSEISQRNSMIMYPESQGSKLEVGEQHEKNKEDQKNHLSLQTLNDNTSAKNQTQLQVLQNLRLLKKIIEKLEPETTFPKLYKFFSQHQIKPQHTDILGQLLALFYPNHQKYNQEKALKLLMDKTKTRLSRQSCYSLMKNYKETFCLSKRWKLIGHQWLDLAVLRFSEGLYGDASQVIEHNLTRTADLQYFLNHNYHEIILNNFSKVQKEEDFVPLLVMIGTTARNPQIKAMYYKQKIHNKLIQSVTKYPQGPKFIANLSYALSSLVYMQPQVCNQLIKYKAELQILLNAFKVQVQNRSIVESGACLIANLSYSNEEVKQTLRQLNTIEIFLFLFEYMLQSPQLSTFKQILRAFGNLSLSAKCSQQLIDQHFCALATRMAQKIDIVVNFDDKKAALMKILIDLIANLASHRYKLQVFHRQQLTSMIITLLQTTQNHLPILTACIDTIDCLCQHSQIQNYVVVQKKIPYLLIDILKIQTDEKIVVKSSRLLTNLTINPACIPHILQANLLNVLANIVMPHFYGNKMASEQNKKMQTYIFKILTRIFHSKPTKEIILKSGYLDCLIRTIETTENIEDSYIEILYQYSDLMPIFLNKRAFISLIKVLTRKINVKDVVHKCLKTIKNLSTFYQRDEEDILISGTSEMYEKLLTSDFKEQGLNLLFYHLLRSNNLRQHLRKKIDKVLELVKKYSEDNALLDTCKQIQFLVYNPYLSFEPSEETSAENEYAQLKKGFKCNLYRIDGSFKKAIIDMNQEYQIRAYKYPDGEIKKKYVINLKNIKDFQFDYPCSDELWGASIFAAEKGLFDNKKSNPKNCCTLISNQKWGQVSYINVQFESSQMKARYFHCIRTIFNSLR